MTRVSGANIGRAASPVVQGREEVNSKLDMAAIAEMTGVDVATVRSWRTRGELPNPDDLVGLRGYRWHPETIQAWWAERRRAAGVKDT